MKLLVLACLPLALHAALLAGGTTSIDLNSLPVEVTDFATDKFTAYQSTNAFITLIGSTDQVNTATITKATSQVGDSYDIISIFNLHPPLPQSHIQSFSLQHENKHNHDVSGILGDLSHTYGYGDDASRRQSRSCRSSKLVEL